LGDGKRFDARSCAASEAHLFEERTGEAVDRAAREAEIPDDDVLAGGEARDQVELLMDDAEPRGIGGGGAGENAGERAFAGAVFADEGMDFTAA
jgi:hypothetical protein